MEAESDEAVLVAARDDADAFAHFYRRHAPTLLGFLVRRSGGQVELAADVCAETFATVLVDIRRFDPARGPALAWLYAIARNKLADAHRRGTAEARARERLGIPRMHLTDEALERIETLIDLSATPVLEELDELPPDQREAVLARVVAGRGYADIARSQDTTEANVRQRVARGLARMRLRLGGTP